MGLTLKETFCLLHEKFSVSKNLTESHLSSEMYLTQSVAYVPFLKRS
jgi:hypothetical protein